MNLRYLIVAVVMALGTASAAENRLDSPVMPSGVLYTNVVVAEVPWSIHVVRIERGNPLYEIHSQHAGGGALGLRTLSDQIGALDSALGTPVAAINGGFYRRDKTYAGCARGLQVAEGEVLSAPSGSATLWIDMLGEAHVATVSSRFEVTWPDGKIMPFGLNGDRARDGLELYTPAAGSSTKTLGGRELVLERQPGSHWLPLRMGQSYSARVREVRQAGNSPLAPEIMILSLGPSILAKCPAVAPGEVLQISTVSSPILRGIRTALSGGPVLVRDGRRQKIRSSPDDAYELSSMLERHPRTAFGWNSRWFFLVQVDGRQNDVSVGMTLDELSAYLVKLGCRDALNLDGGGSSTLWCGGQVRNHPCDGYERTVANSLIVVRKDLSKAKAGSGRPLAKTPGERSSAE